ncbi:MAG: hypothetical protein KatS3mg039_1542 [Candidatus Kapaibacterium sp.]|nr:MAG: hypothetical protein KatS3mg039_1542 [Candidatus Kapabacteria bacterium]
MVLGTRNVLCRKNTDFTLLFSADVMRDPPDSIHSTDRALDVVPSALLLIWVGEFTAP